uniref:JmjC domain-containing protein n=1 Tax=Psilocybe cubensis TaxID=181762 RepID=A0A8H7Y3T5_PSICU
MSDCPEDTLNQERPNMEQSEQSDQDMMSVDRDRSSSPVMENEDQDLLRLCDRSKEFTMANKLDVYTDRVVNEKSHEFIAMHDFFKLAPGHPMKLPNKSNFVNLTGLMVGYRVFDIYAQVRGLHKEREVVMHKKLKTATGPTRFWNYLDNWQKVLLDAKKSLKSLRLFSSPTSSDNSQGSSPLCSLLLHMSQLQGASRGIIILQNFVLACLSVALLRDPKFETIDLPKSPMEFFEIVNNLVPDNTRYDFTENVLTSNRNHDVRNPLTLAALCSPLFLLVGGSLVAHHFDKKELFLTAKSIGNDLDSNLKEVVSGLWEVIFDCAEGKSQPATALISWLEGLHLDDIDDGGWYHEGDSSESLDNVLAFSLAGNTVPASWQQTVFVAEVNKRALLTSGPTNQPSTSNATGGNAADAIPQETAPHTQSSQGNDPPATPGVNPTSTEGRNQVENKTMDDDAAGESGLPEMPAQTAGQTDNTSPTTSDPTQGKEPEPPNSTTGQNACDDDADKDSDSDSDSDSDADVDADKDKDEDKGNAADNNADADIQKAAPTSPPVVGGKRKRPSLKKRLLSKVQVPRVQIRYTTARPAPRASKVAVVNRFLSGCTAEVKVEAIDIEDLKVDTELPITLDNTKQKRVLFKQSECLVVFDGQGTEIQLRPAFHCGIYAKLLKDAVQAASQANIDGKPVHAASPSKSKIVVMDDLFFNNSHPPKRNAALQNGVIVVLGCKLRNMSFDLDSLSRICDIHKVISVQDQSVDPSDNTDNTGMMRTSTLATIYANKSKKTGKILNALDLPEFFFCEQTCFSTDLKAWQYTQGLAFSKDQIPPISDIRWWLVATADAIHGWHIDCDGLGTIITCEIGMKVIFIALEPSSTSSTPSTSSIDRFANDNFDPIRMVKDSWDVQAICLQRGDQIVIPPNTMHMVYTAEPSICFGAHFYSLHTMKESLCGYIHSFLAHSICTNTAHPNTRSLIHRLVSFYHKSVTSDSSDMPADVAAHLPDLNSLKNIISIISLCSLTILLHVLSPETYTFPEPPHGREATPSATHKLQQYLNETYDLNTFHAADRYKYMHMRALAWRILGWLRLGKLRYKPTSTSKSKSPFPSTKEVHKPDANGYFESDIGDDVLTPFMGNLVLSLLSYNELADQHELRPPVPMTIDAFRSQLMGAFVKAESVTEYVQRHLADAPRKDLIMDFDYGFEWKFERANASQQDIKDFLVNLSGITAQDELYLHGQETNWLIYQTEDVMDVDSDSNSGEEQDDANASVESEADDYDPDLDRRPSKRRK